MIVFCARSPTKGKRRALFVGTAADDHDGTTVDHDEQRTGTIGGGEDEGQGSKEVVPGSGSCENGEGDSRSSTGGEQLGAGSRSRSVTTGEKLLEAVLLTKALQQNP